MFRCRWEFVVFAAMVAGQPMTAIADELSSPNVRTRSVPTASTAEENRQNVNSPLSQPAVAPDRGVAARKDFDGTWREEPDYVIINIDGREMKLRRSGPDQGRPISVPPNAADGMVQGRLLQNGAPLVNCRVVMIGMEREGMCDEVFEPMTSITDERGVYRFERVPAGKYKFTWLPEGTKYWIRRIQMKPDVIVRSGQNAVVKDIRAAQRTIN